MRVFVLDKNKKPLDPCTPRRARILLNSGRAAVFRRYPFTIILKDRVLEESVTHEHQLKLDSGAKTTGIAILEENKVIWAAELTHRGFQIRDELTSRSQVRRSRRQRKTRYRRCKCPVLKKGRKYPVPKHKRNGWLPPSLRSRIQNIETWVNRIRRYCPITGISQELVRFDTQKLQNPEISGVEYQQGELFGYEVREYLLEKFNRKCVYCDHTERRLEIEHVLARSRGGSNRISNLVISCVPCNQAKGNRDIRDFLCDRLDVLAEILKLALEPLATGLPVETGSGGMTKFNRTRNGMEKTHWADAANVGASTPDNLKVEITKPLIIKACGHGNRLICQMDKRGFPKKNKQGELVRRQRQKVHFGYQTGDMVRAVLPKGKNAGIHVGRLTTRATGVFELTTQQGKISPVNWKYCTPIHRHDGYSYSA
jgi:5-methylcytosine-specific restriction endonuclease McrA